MKNKVLWGSLAIMLISVVVYAGSGDLIVNGKLGVGMAVPVGKLDVNGAVRLGAPNYDSWFPYTDNNAYITGDNIIFRKGSGGGFGEVVRILTSSGSVGIGTTSPIRKFHVYGAGGASDSILLSNGFLEVDGANSNAAVAGGTANLRIGWPTTTRVAFNLQGNEVMTMTPGGRVGIGLVDPAEKLDVAGSIAIYGTVKLSSDRTFKRNIEPILNPLMKVLALKGLSYEWKTDEYKDRGFSEGRHYGVIAQEIEKVLPEVVSTAPDGMKSVAYTEIIPVLIEAIKEQQKEIEALKSKVAELAK